MPNRLTDLEGTLCIPGQRICETDDQHYSGKGTYTLQNYIYASVAGVLKVVKEEKINTIEISRGRLQNPIPLPGSVVTCRITSISSRFAKCLILCIESTILKEPFRGQIRKEDVRATKKDTVEIYRCMRPGDIILARVLSIGDAHSYSLTTAENELGVAIAHSEAGVPMVPISWTEMQCPQTMIKEERKVARQI